MAAAMTLLGLRPLGRCRLLRDERYSRTGRPKGDPVFGRRISEAITTSNFKTTKDEGSSGGDLKRSSAWPSSAISL